MIHKSVLVPCSPARAFELFTQRASAWWPPGRRHTSDPRSEIHLVASGRFCERATDGAEVELGRVRAWEAPHRVALDFYVDTDAEHPTEVDVTFLAEDEGTLVRIDHRPTAASEALWTARAPRFEAWWERVLEALERGAEALMTHR